VLGLPGRWTETAVVGEDGGRGGADGARLEFVHPVNQTCKGGAQKRLGTRTQGAGSKTRRGGDELLELLTSGKQKQDKEGHLLRWRREGKDGENETLGGSRGAGGGLYGGEALLATLAPIDVDASSPA